MVMEYHIPWNIEVARPIPRYSYKVYDWYVFSSGIMSRFVIVSAMAV